MSIVVDPIRGYESSATAPARRVLSGMRPTGRLHLGTTTVR